MRKEHVPGYLMVVLLIAVACFVFFVIGPETQAKKDALKTGNNSAITAITKK